MPADEAMQFVAAPEPSIDELVTKAATDTGRFSFSAEETPSLDVYKRQRRPCLYMVGIIPGGSASFQPSVPEK